MRSNSIIYILFICVMLASSMICLAENTTSASAANLTVPKEMLPEGFKLLAVLPEMDPNVNMTEYISDFYGAEDIGPAAVTVGIYQWGKPGEAYDAKVTLIQLQDEEHADAAISNYKSNPEFQKPPFVGVDRFASALINGHNATEIRKRVNGQTLRYLYLWRNGSTVVLVEGNGDLGKSRDLASATGL
ncbi:MAG: hypothetical protein A4E44_01708 [Methanosaeta sp. PtaB.Bin018]|nr:hypothetical protein [Methanothrix sp.]OPX74893.1 MAG: hypothetical protein A4E44_01708 [Methanosaeta sp. PtaB.Bin018]OPY46164.1 MAG: hypothetical protein A4E46_00996 [Methanosaeta sp. PtaU1.Bin016]